MARRKWIWDPKLNMNVEVDLTYVQPRPEVPMVMGDIDPFVSTVDGSVVSGRAALREHNRRHNVTNVADYKNEWAAAARERERFFTGDPSFRRKDRLNDIIRAVDQHTRRK